MPENITPHDKKNDSDEANNSEKQPERHAWQPPESTGAKSWWQEGGPSPVVPPSEEVRSYAAEQQARKMSEWSFGEVKKDTEEDEKDQKSDRQDEESSVKKTQETQTTRYPETTQTEESEQEAEVVAGSDTAPEKSEEHSEESIEAAKEIAREELEIHEPGVAEDDPTVDYLEKVAEHGLPAEAEQETIEEHDLSEVQAEADLLVQDLEELLETAAAKVGDRKDLSYEEMTEIAKEIVPEPEEDVQPEIEAFAPEPSEPPEIITRPDLLTESKDVLPTPITRHNFYKAPVTPTFSGSGSLPPVTPPGSGFGGGGGGGFGNGANRLAGAAAGAINPNMQPIWQGLSAAERAAERKKNMNKTLFVALFAYYLGRHVGKKKGRNEAEAELKPDLEKQSKINKQQRDEITAGQKRIDSLKRIQEAQEHEQFKQEQQERFTRKKEQSILAEAQRVRPNAEASAGMSRLERPEEALSQSIQEQLPAAPELGEQVPSVSKADVITPTPRMTEILSSAPELPQEQNIHPETNPELSSMASQQPERFAAEQPIESTPQREALEPTTVEEAFDSQQETTSVPSLEAAPPDHDIAPESTTESAEPERYTGSSSSRPEIATTTPGLEIPLPTGLPERQSFSSENVLETAGIETKSPAPSEAFDAQTVATMNLPELLAIAKEITVDGESLGQLFQEKQIDADSLRRVVTEYARGGHPEQVLAQERQIMEIRHQSPEFLRSQTTTHQGGGAAPQGGGGAGLFTQTESTDRLLPAYDHEQYPSDTPQHLLPAYDQETVSKKQHRIVIAASAMIGLGTGIILGLLLL